MQIKLTNEGKIIDIKPGAMTGDNIVDQTIIFELKRNNLLISLFDYEVLCSESLIGKNVEAEIEVLDLDLRKIDEKQLNIQFSDNLKGHEGEIVGKIVKILPPEKRYQPTKYKLIVDFGDGYILLYLNKEYQVGDYIYVRGRFDLKSINEKIDSVIG